MVACPLEGLLTDFGHLKDHSLEDRCFWQFTLTFAELFPPHHGKQIRNRGIHREPESCEILTDVSPASQWNGEQPAPFLP